VNTPSIYGRRNLSVSQDMTAGLGAGMHPRISIKGNRFTLIDAGGNKHPWPQLVLPVVIVGANPRASKIYYDGPYDPESGSPPTCFSDNGIAPSQHASYKQSATCATCPHFGWGSATSQLTGKPTKACDDKKKIAVKVLGDPAFHTYELQVPPASLRGLNTYGAFVSSRNTPDNARKADVSDVITLLSFVPDAVGMLKFDHWGWIESIGPNGQVFFQNGQPITAPDGGLWFYEHVDALVEDGIIDELVGLNDIPFQAPAGFIAPTQQPSQVAYHPQGGQGQLPVQQPQTKYVAGEFGPGGPAATPYGGPGGQPAQPQTMQPTAPAHGGARPGAGRKPRQPRAPSTAPAVQAQNVMPFPGQNAAAPAPTFAPAQAFTPGATAPVELPQFIPPSSGGAAAAPAQGNAAQPFGNAGAAPPDLAATLARAMELNTTRSE
jgi:hypothetical protein